MRSAALVVAALVVASGLAGPALAVATTGSTTDALQSDSALDPPETTLVVDLREEGHANWTVTARYTLEDDADRRAFDQYAEGFQDGDVQPVLTVAFFEQVAGAASEVAGREMSIENVDRDAEREDGVGDLRLNFTWTNFLGQRDDGRLVLRDAFRTSEDESWLESLESGQTLIVRTPEGYVIDSTSTQLLLQNDSFIVRGPHTFDGEQPLEVVYAEGERTPPPPDSLDWEVLAAGLLVLLAALIAAFVLRRGGDGGPAESASESPDDDAGDGAAAAGGAADAEGDEAGIDPTLLSDEERVEHLLEEAGGRMRQADIVAETGWSDAKVSQLLSTMADEGRIEKLRIGRENLISLPDSEDGDGQ